MDETLQLGSTGNDVKILQEKLKILGFYNAVITGQFGLATEEGVKAFQRQIGLEATGIVDSETWNRLQEYTEPAIAPISLDPTLRPGSSGNDVSDLQAKLKALLYYTGNITGNFDLETENAVKRFQLNNDLTATGIVDSQTWNAINNLYGNINRCALEGEAVEDNDTYTVQQGDTLYQIAKRFNTTVDAIKSLNNLTSDTLQIGQVLKIPTTMDNDYIRYTVVSGDSLYQIARRYNTTVQAIKNYNNLTSDVLQIGQVLLIPTDNTSTYIDYIVERGDTLYQIARRYGTSIDTLRSLNNLTTDVLQIGQVLKIPTTAGTNYITYTVVSGDSLYQIARRYNTTVQALQELNNLTTTVLQIGQTLKIPI